MEKNKHTQNPALGFSSGSLSTTDFQTDKYNMNS